MKLHLSSAAPTRKVSVLVLLVVFLMQSLLASSTSADSTAFITFVTPQIAAGYAHTCALEASGVVKCWGDNFSGQLGLGDTNDRGDGANEMGANLVAVDLGLGVGVTVTAITAGSYHTCAVSSTGAVKCWGWNGFGQLGLGDTNARGDGANEMGANLPVVDLGAGVTVTAITAALLHTCALLSSGAVKCWGYNYSGQLGLGDTNKRGDGANEMGANLPVVDLGAGVTVTAITAVFYHTCALLSSGAVKCWGANRYGQLGLGDTNDRGNGPDEMGANLVAVDLGLGAGVTVAAITAGSEHNCALLSSGAVKCWGTGGVLGLGDRNDRGDGADEMGANLVAVDLGLGVGVTVTAISTGGFHNCAVLSSRAVKCWGSNRDGQLGLGDTNTRGDGADEMGVNLPISYQFLETRAAQIITFSAPIDRAISATPFTVTATSDSNLLVTLTSSTTTVCTVSGLQVIMLTVGLCTLTASRASDSNYLSATDVVRSFTITNVIPPSAPIPTPEQSPGVIPTTTTVTVTTTVPTAAVNVASAPSVTVINALPRATLSTSPMILGGNISVTYAGFTPGETVQLIVASTPRVVGTGVANATGSVTVSGSIPSNIGTGQHTVALYAPVSEVGFRQIVTVSAAMLPSTGSNSTSPLGVGVLTLLTGVVLMAGRRRRAPNDY